eukprot:511982_1
MLTMSTPDVPHLKYHNSKCLTRVPFGSVSHSFLINTAEFIVATKTSNLNEITKRNGWIYKFNINKNEWTKILNYGDDLGMYLGSIATAYDNERQLLYVSDHFETMLQFDLKTKNKMTLMTDGKTLRYCKFILVDNKLHTISFRDGGHYIYDVTNQFQKITTFQVGDIIHQ